MINRILIPDILQPVSHYCHVVEANGVVWVSGLVGMNFDGTIPESTKDQFDIAIRDLNTCIEAAGGSSKDVVKVRVFLTNIDDRAIINPKRVDTKKGYEDLCAAGVTFIFLIALNRELRKKGFQISNANSIGY